MKLLAELKERHLYKVTVIYAAVAWLLLQVADVVVESFDWPQWFMQGLILVALLGLPVTLLIFWFLGEPDAPVSDSPTPASTPIDLPEERPGLIVLPFDCFSDEASDQWATDALTEDLTTLIARFSDYSVIARNTAFTYRGKSVDVRALGSELGVRYVLEGSVRRLPGILRVTAQLIEAQSGAHLWAEQYDRGEDDFEQLHDELCRSIVLKLGNELTRAEMNLSRRKPPAELGVWELYQQAKGTLQFSGWSKETFAKVADLLEQAIDKDPEYAPAQAYLALILALGHWARLYPDREATFSASVAAGQRAMALAPESSEVLGFVGCALSDLGQHDRGIPIIERAIELNPSNSQAFAALGAAKVLSGQLEEGISDLRHAVTISPADPGLAPWSTILSIAQSYMGNKEEAMDWADRARKYDPRYFGSHVALAMAYAGMARNEEAQQALQDARQWNPDLTEEAATALVGKLAWDQLSKAGITLTGTG